MSYILFLQTDQISPAILIFYLVVLANCLYLNQFTRISVCFSTQILTKILSVSPLLSHNGSIFYDCYVNVQKSSWTTLQLVYVDVTVFLLFLTNVLNDSLSI